MGSERDDDADLMRLSLLRAVEIVSEVPCEGHDLFKISLRSAMRSGLALTIWLSRGRVT